MPFGYANSKNVDHTWFTYLENLILALVNQYSYALTDGQLAAALTSQSFNGAAITSVKFEMEVKRGTTVLANGIGWMQYLNGTWHWVFPGGWEDSAGVDPGLTFTIDQTGAVGDLEVATSSGPGAGTLKIKRVTFNA